MADSRVFEQVLQVFERLSSFRNLEYSMKERSDGRVLIIPLANPTERLFELLEVAVAEVQAQTEEPIRATLEKRRSPNQLLAPEGRLLLKTLSESLNINRNSFKDDFFSRYTKSVSQAEEQIVAASNHIVFGRRGAGKSSLLLFGLHTREELGLPCVWVDMQVYSQRNDVGVVVDLLVEILTQASQHQEAISATGVLTKLSSMSDESRNSESEIRKLLPEVRRTLQGYSTANRNLTIYLDDFHALDVNVQPRVLGHLYGVARGNQIFLKLSAIEIFTRTWDPASATGLQIAHDIQQIELDYNLTIPEKATEHITSILEAHAVYCALPSIRAVCTSPDVLSRLVWVSAGVPRDALNVFAQAMTKSGISGGKLVSVSSINVAASDALTVKLYELDADASADAQRLHEMLEEIKDFCIRQQQKNAFLMEIKTDQDDFKLIRKLVDLRMLHVISEGLSVGRAGRKYLALILDYGFYTGIRAARSVDLFNKQTKKVAYRDLRKLPVFHG